MDVLDREWQWTMGMVIFVFLIPRIHGWGKDGHYATCKIAEVYLSYFRIQYFQTMMRWHLKNLEAVNFCFRFLKIKRIIWRKFFVRDRIISRTMLWLQSKPCFQVMLKVILLLFARGQMMFATKPTIAGAALCIMLIRLTLGATTTTAVSTSLLLKLYYLFVLLLDSFF